MATKQEIMRLVEEEDVKFIRLQFTDILGNMRNIAVTEKQLSDALDNQCIIDASSLDGFVDAESSDLKLYPDLNTFTIFPWRPHQGKVARLICDLYTVDGKPLAFDPRRVLKQTVAEAAKLGYVFEAGPECEFFLFKTDDEGRPTLEPHDEAGYFELAPMDNGENCRRDICLTLEEMGYQIEASHHESARGQHEIIFKHSDVLTTADRIVTFRSVVKTIAQRHGLHATFMPKPFTDEFGSGMHINMSLFDFDGNNVFYDAETGERISRLGRDFISGLLKFTPDMVCLTNPTVNSYKRFIPGYDAPCYISWSMDNTSLLVRVPQCARPENARIELRSPDLTANPYLALAACLKAGLMGIENKYPLPAEIDVNIQELTNAEREALGIKRLPISLNEAVKIAAKSDFITDVLGGELKTRYLTSKAKEYDGYRRSVSQWEIDKYFIRY